jgi:hypothetical protein
MLKKQATDLNPLAQYPLPPRLQANRGWHYDQIPFQNRGLPILG